MIYFMFARKKLLLFVWAEFFNFFLPIFFSLLILGIAFKITTIGDIETVYISFKQFTLISFCLLSLSVPIVLPLSYLISLILLLTKASQTYELTTLFISRISVKRLFIALLIPSILLSLLCLLNSLYFKSYAHAKFQRLINIQPYEAIKNLRSGTIKCIDKNTFIFANNENDKFYNVFYYKSHKGKSNITIISAKSMFLPPNSFFQLVFNDGSLVTINGADATISDFGTLAISPFKPKFLDEISARSIPTKSLFYITKNDNETNRERAELCERIFLPLSPILLLITVFTVIVSNNKTGQIKRMLISLFVGIAFFAIFFVTYSLGKNEGVPTFSLFSGIFVAEFLLSSICFNKKFRQVF